MSRFGWGGASQNFSELISFQQVTVMNDDTASESATRELEGKNIAHYQVMLSAWIENRMEHDRTLIKLSLAGIGFLLTLLMTLGVSSKWQMACYVASLVCFLITIGILLVIFNKNSDLIESEIRGDDSIAPSLIEYDRWVSIFFAAGVFAAIVIGLLEMIVR